MSKQDDDPKRPDAPQIFKVSRRTFLRRTAAGMLGGLAVKDASDVAAESKSSASMDSNRRVAGQVRLFSSEQPFLSPVQEVFPVLDARNSRLIAVAGSGWLALWSFDEPGQPKYTGQGSCCPPPALNETVRAFRRPGGDPAALAENGSAVAWYEADDSSAVVEYRDGTRLRLALPADRGAPLCLGLGESGNALAIGFGRGGILVFDLRNGKVRLVGDFVDASLRREIYCAEEEPCPESRSLLCSCDLVSARGEARDSARVSRYDSVTGTVSTMTRPCGTSVPAGWVCACNCVRMPAWHIVHHYCSCDQVCTCNQVCTCDTVSTTYTYTYTYTYLYPN